MRDQDDAPYVVIERDGGGGLGSFVLGALVGAGLALLFAPKSGLRPKKTLKSTRGGFVALLKNAFAKHSVRLRSASRRFERVCR